MGKQISLAMHQRFVTCSYWCPISCLWFYCEALWAAFYVWKVLNKYNLLLWLTSSGAAFVCGSQRTFRQKTQVEFECRGLRTLGWHHRSSMQDCFYTFEELIPSYFNCIGFGCNAVYPWNSKRVLWTQTLHPPLHQHSSGVDNEGIFIFWVNYPFKINFHETIRVINLTIIYISVVPFGVPCRKNPLEMSLCNVPPPNSKTIDPPLFTSHDTPCQNTMCVLFL